MAGTTDQRVMQTANVASFAASASALAYFYFPRPARILRYFAVPGVAEAAHATQVLDATFVSKGTDGAGSTTLAVLTNDSDLADSATRESGAWVAFDVKELLTEARPSLDADDPLNVRDEIAANTVILCTLAKAAGTTTGAAMCGIEFVWSD